MTARRDKLARVRVDHLRPEEYVMRFGPRRRVDRLVLLDIARAADWWTDDARGKQWGAHSYVAVELIAGRIGYCERSVQYALRRLTADGYLEIDERPGRQHHFLVLRQRHLTAVDDSAETVDNPVDEEASAAPPTGASVAPPGATVAPLLPHVPEEPPPVAPQHGPEESVGAGAPAQAPPQWRRPGGPGPAAAPPPAPVASVAEPHRRDARRRAASATRRPLSEAAVAGLGSALSDLGDAGPGDPLSSALVDAVRPAEHWTRDAARRLRPCPTCGAAAGEACRRRNGNLRVANHAARRIPR